MSHTVWISTARSAVWRNRRIWKCHLFIKGDKYVGRSVAMADDASENKFEYARQMWLLEKIWLAFDVSPTLMQKRNHSFFSEMIYRRRYYRMTVGKFDTMFWEIMKCEQKKRRNKLQVLRNKCGKYCVFNTWWIFLSWCRSSKEILSYLSERLTILRCSNAKIVNRFWEARES